MLIHAVKIPGLCEGAPGSTNMPDLNKNYNTLNLPLGAIRFLGKEKWLPEIKNFVFDYVRPMEDKKDELHRKDQIDGYKKTGDILEKDSFMKKYTTPLLHTVYKYGAKMNQRGFVYEDKHPTLYRMAMVIGLEDPQIIALKYSPGTCALIHTDQHPGYDMYDPRRKSNNHAPKNNEMQRVMVQLQDRKPGSFMQFDGEVWNNWNAGDVNIFDERYFHSYGNASKEDRWVLRVTGRITDKFREFLTRKEIQL